MAKKKADGKKSGGPAKSSQKHNAKASSKKNSLVGNINKRKQAGTSRSKKSSTVSNKAYEEMQAGWPQKKRRKSDKD